MYIVIEIQQTDKVATIVTAYEDLNTAYQKYYTILAAAAVSKIPVHGAVILTAKGDLYVSQHFEHNEEE